MRRAVPSPENAVMSDFYDRMASLYHLIFQDWDKSIERQAEQFSAIIEERWGAGTKHILDVSCGIGTQAIGLAKRGFTMTACDLSNEAISRAKAEAQGRGVEIDFCVCDMRALHAHHQRQFDVVISADNSITHLLNDDDLLLVLQEMYACTRPGGGCFLTVRDYDREERGVGLVKPYGVREENGKRYVIFQVWDFVDRVYDLAMYVVVDDRTSGQLATHVMRTKYNAVGTDHLLALMGRAGFTRVERLDGRFYQPVLLGHKDQ
jgi:SAM-dependent methyltransferase